MSLIRMIPSFAEYTVGYVLCAFGLHTKSNYTRVRIGTYGEYLCGRGCGGIYIEDGR